MPGKHAKLSPSSAKIWMACPGMPRLAEGIEDTSSVFAEEGTAAHELAELCLVENAEASDYLGVYVNDFEVDEEMAQAVQVYLDYCRGETREGDDVRIEQRMKLTDNVWGTADYVRYSPKTKELLVADYKHGQGVEVEVEENPQALIYAIMAAESLHNQGVKDVKLAIIQPRCRGQSIKEWSIPFAELEKWKESVIQAAKETEYADADLNPGEHCRWCKVAATCPALIDMAYEKAKEDFEPLDGVTEPEEIARRLAQVPALKTYIKSIESFAYQQAMEGNLIPNHKLVKKRPTRNWADEKQTLAFLKTKKLNEEDIFERKVKSPAQIEKLLGKDGKKDVAELVVKESSGLTLVPDSDKRAAVDPTDPSNDFDPLD